MDLPARGTTALVRGAIDWLATIAPAEGGAAFAEPPCRRGPHAPWWVPAEGNPASLIQTGQIAGVLYARGFTHPWLDRRDRGHVGAASTQLTEPNAYEMFGVLAFLQHVPDRPRAQDAFSVSARCSWSGTWSRSTRRRRGDVHTPLDFAPLPGSIARALFDDATIAAHLDHLAGAQRDDGGWMFNWLAWSPAAEADWRGFLTVDALRVPCAPTAARRCHQRTSRRRGGP